MPLDPLERLVGLEQPEPRGLQERGDSLVPRVPRVPWDLPEPLAELEQHIELLQVQGEAQKSRIAELEEQTRGQVARIADQDSEIRAYKAKLDEGKQQAIKLQAQQKRLI